MVELVGFISILVTVVVLYPYTKERHVEKGKLPFDKNRLKVK